MAVICCATPSELYLEETRSTLQFAARAKMVKTRAKVNEVLDDRAVIKKLQAELNEVKKLAGGNKAIKRFKMMEKERDEKSAHADKIEQQLAHLKNCIIKGGTLFNPLPTVHPSLRTPAKAKRNNRRMTVEPKAARGAMLLDNTPEFPKKEKDTRRKSVGTALCGLRPSTLLPPSPALHATAGLSSFISATSDGTASSNRRLSTDSATSSTSKASRLSLESTESEAETLKANQQPGAKNTPHSSELDLLRQALRAKGTQNKNLKEQLEALKTLTEDLKSTKETLEAERDDIGSECEELIKQNSELQAGKVQDAETKIMEGEKVKELEEKVKMANEEIEAIKMEAEKAGDEIKAASKELNDAKFKLSAAQDDNEDLMEELKEKTAGLEETVKQLENENSDLKKENEEVASLQSLLQNSNEAIEEARQTAVDLEADFNKNRAELEGEVEALKQDLEDALAMAEEAQESAATANVNLELEAKIKDMEEMHKLEIDELREEMSASKRSVAIEFSQATSTIKGELATVTSELSLKENEAYELKQKVEDLQEQQTSAEAQMYEKQQLIEDLQEQVETTELGATAARNAADQAQITIFELTKNAKKLEAELKSAKEETSDEGSEVVEKLKAELAAKDARIKKLEAVRLTKEQCAALKKMKEERISYMKKARELEKVNERLRTSSSDGSISDEVHTANLSEIAKLKESNAVIGDKLRKYAEHCQKIEAEKAAIIDTIQSTGGAVDVENDFAGAVASLCEKLSAAEEECEALASAETRANTYLTQLDRAKEVKAKLVDNEKVQADRIAKLQSIEATLSENLNNAENKVAELEALTDELKSMTNNIAGEKGEVEAEKTKQVRFLEQENLNLMMETKTLKRNLQTVSAELAAYRATSISSSPALKEIDGNAGTPGTGSSKNTPKAKSSTKKRVTRKRAAMMKAAVKGLGDSDDIGTEDNTEECKQS
ncbi:hypothetical protein TrRE_jg2670 [Triparma retinervis]|uniref:Kinesin motor domain-containing protein n=1 Tax=Triparma retinervis TaxID=2557542 RepID=A0A9W7FBP3_9STRA|nr:hypothetical protein TrRE_jg2670 [Triparma retinervis]